MMQSVDGIILNDIIDKIRYIEIVYENFGLKVL